MVSMLHDMRCGNPYNTIEGLLHRFPYGKGISCRYAMEQMLAARGCELHPAWEVGNADVITRFLPENGGSIIFAGICGV